jgi:hypothetical protein
MLFRAFLALRRPVIPVIVSIVALASLVGWLVTSAGGSAIAMPEAGVVARWTIAALVGLGAWAGTSSLAMQIAAAAAFLAGYLLVLIAPLTKYWTDATGAIRSSPELWIGRAKSR